MNASNKQPEQNANATGAAAGSESDMNDELSKARQRSSELEQENRRLKQEALRAKKAAGSYEDVAAVIEGEGRVGAFFRHMNRSVLALVGVGVGAALGVGGTVLVQSRMNRTAVGTTTTDGMDVHLDAQ